MDFDSPHNCSAEVPKMHVSTWDSKHVTTTPSKEYAKMRLVVIYIHITVIYTVWPCITAMKALSGLASPLRS